ncbi:MAG: hypothetical protein N2115_01725 [bacterium]|nr:hypothetical protein [bacterium]
MKKLAIIFLILLCNDLIYCQTNPAEVVKKVQQIIINILKENKQWDISQMYTKYVSDILDKTSGDKWWNDKNGYFRLNIIDRWLRNPIDCFVEGESLTRELHGYCKTGSKEICNVLRKCADCLDLQVEISKKSSEKNHMLIFMNESIKNAETNVKNCLSHFSPQKLAEFMELTERLTVRQLGDVVAHTLPEKQTGLALASMVAKIDMPELISAAMFLCEIFNHPDFEKTKRLKPGRYGKILVGTMSNDKYDIDTMKGIACIIDPAGNDTYIGGKTTAEKPVLMLIDFQGNDRYIAPDGYSQGAGFFGISILYDENGNDIYESTDVCQGTGLMGIGILIDNHGDDTYTGDRRAQGSAVCGIGILIDREGNDKYLVRLFGQGYGGMYGIGIIEDSDGNDYYIAGGKYDEPYQEPPGRYKHAWSQGCGSGFRGISNGGLGILLDGSGDDIYENDYFSTGGYWFAAGLARDFDGNDIRKPLTNDFTRYGFGYSCHYAIGLLYDDTGNDTYTGTLGIQGFGWDIGTAALLDFSGDDIYTATISGQGFACQGSWALLIDGNGSDAYNGPNPSRVQGIPGPLEYHPKNLIGGNFSFLIDIGKGDNRFSSGPWQKSVNPRVNENGIGYLVQIE